MAVPSDTQQTYQTIGNREDLSAYISMISPVETPFMSACGFEKARNTYTEWQIDTLAQADGDNKVVEGDDPGNDQAVPTTRVGNYTQIMDKVVQVSTTQNAVNSAGRKSELSWQLVKRAQELKRDMEARLTGNYASTAGDSATARETAGAEAWITTNASRGVGGAGGGFSSGTVSAATDGTQRNFTEGLLKNVIADCWAAGGSPGLIIVGPHNKQVASGFGGIASLYRDTAGSNKPATIIGAADLYVSDFGEHRIVPDRFSRDRSALVIDSEHWCIRFLQPIRVQKLAKSGHSERRLISAEFALSAKNEASSGIVADLTTS